MGSPPSPGTQQPTFVPSWPPGTPHGPDKIGETPAGHPAKPELKTWIGNMNAVLFSGLPAKRFPCVTTVASSSTSVAAVAAKSVAAAFGPRMFVPIQLAAVSDWAVNAP